MDGQNEMKPCVCHLDLRVLVSASRMATTSAIVLRCAGSPFQHPLIIPHTRSESSGQLGRAGRRPVDTEWTPVATVPSENGPRPAKT